MTETAPQTITAEGPTLEDALHQAAATLGVSPSQVEYKFDLAHFRSAAGRAMGVDTVRVFAWARQAPAAAPGAEVSRAWLETLLGHMGMKGEVLANLSPSGPNRVSLQINSPDARFLVGRQGTTLQAIVELLEAAMAIQQPGWQFRLDIEGGQRAPREDDRGARDDRGQDRGPPRDDRGPPRDDRDGGPRGPDRGPRREYESRGRREDRGPDRGPPRDDRDGGPRVPPRGGRDDRGGSEDRRRTEQDLEKLRRLALRLAQEVARTGEPAEIHRELNSYERRVVHVAVSEVEGVASESVGDGTTKQVRILPTGRPAKAREEDPSDTPTQE